MRIWLTTIGEPVPVQGNTRDRLHRTGCFAHLLADRGHDVIWWTSTFDHFRKKHWFDGDRTLRVNDGLEIRLLHGGGYQSNVSLARFRDHWRIARKYATMVRCEPAPPDIIVAALPTIELCLESVRYGRERGVPVVLDMRDMWPDIFVDHAPRPARPIARLLLSPLFRQAGEACEKATAITGITEAFVEWGVNRGNRRRGELDRDFPTGYVSKAPPEEHLRAAERFWDDRGVVADGPEMIVSFVGTIGRQFDLTTVLQAARKLAEKGRRIRWVICGTGDQLEHYRRMAGDLPGVLFPGWVDAAAIYILLRRSKLGLDPLPDRYDFLATINNKAVEYLSAGLPILSCPNAGLLATLTAREQCGLSYTSGDVDGLASLFERLGNDRQSLDTMAVNARRVFQERFIAEKVYSEMMAYLEGVVATTAAGRGSVGDRA